MSQETLDVKNIYIIGENLKARVEKELDQEFSGQRLVSWLLAKDGQVKICISLHSLVLVL